MSLNADGEVYIDVEDALKRIGGNMDLYKRLLGRFVEGNDMATMEAAISSGNVEEAARLAHTIKGVSSNLSLVKVAAASIDLEHSLKEGQDHTANYENLKQAFNTTVAKIAEITG